MTQSKDEKLLEAIIEFVSDTEHDSIEDIEEELIAMGYNLEEMEARFDEFFYRLTMGEFDK